MNTTRKGFLGSIAALLTAPIIKAKEEEPKTFVVNTVPEKPYRVMYLTSCYTGGPALPFPQADRDAQPLPYLSE